ncbi:ROK family protein [Luteolibacter sp. LG18]|uniref:ROK family protein n=1 Tax=Luteolibacter sp. LG18 TaxID=2819286 RepID=UPI002B2D9265|nr:glucokinase [Luteolibacter sp. LG18]
MSDTPLAIGIDFGGTSVKTGVVFRGNVIDHAPPISTQDFDEPEALIDAMVRVVEDLRSRHSHIAAIGVGMPGFVDFDRGVVYNLTNVRGWVEIPLKAKLQEKTGLPTIVENDANCMAYAEWKRGAGRGLKHLVCLTLGTGVGGGIIANGQMIRGARHGAGEVGQTSIDYRGRRGAYGNLGALEDYIGNNEITNTAVEAYHAAGTHKSAEDCTPAGLAAAAHAGDPIALQIWDDVGEKLACTIMNCCWLLNPEAIIIGGGVARAGDLVFGPMTSHLYAQLSPPFKDHLMILPARFGNEAGMIGAAALALEQAGYPVEP